MLFSTPSATRFFKEAVREYLQVEPHQLSFNKGFLAGEALSDQERERIERTWGITARNFYGLADVAADIAAECGEAPGLHFCAQGVLVAEIIDPETQEVLALPLKEEVKRKWLGGNAKRILKLNKMEKRADLAWL